MKRPIEPTAHKLASLARDLEPVLTAAVAEHFLRCSRCGREERPTREEIAGYFRAGWPECCGEMMRLTAPAEVSND